MASYIVVDTSDEIIFAIQTPTEGVIPDKINDTDQIVEIPDASFSFNITTMNYDFNTQQIIPRSS